MHGRGVLALGRIPKDGELEHYDVAIAGPTLHGGYQVGSYFH